MNLGDEAEHAVRFQVNKVCVPATIPHNARHETPLAFGRIAAAGRCGRLH